MRPTCHSKQLKVPPRQDEKERVCGVFHSCLRMQRSLENALSLWFRGSGQESQSNHTCDRSQNESQLFLLALPSRWQTLDCRSQNFKMCFQGGIAFMFVSSLNLDHFSQCPSCIGPRSLFCFGRVLGVLLMESKPSLHLPMSLLQSQPCLPRTL